MPLSRIPFDQTNRPVMSFASFGEGFDFDAPYQRGHVWTLAQRQQLVKSLMQAIPIGVIYLNFRNWKDAPVVVDGKQRLTSIMSFLDDGFAVPARWFADEETEAGEHPSLLASAAHRLDEEILFSHLTDIGQGRFTRNAVAFYETRLPTLAEEADLYLRVNEAGRAHEAADLVAAREILTRG